WNHSALGLIVASFLVALVAGGTFLWIEMKSTEPMLPLDLLHSWNISAGLLIGLLYQFSFYGMLFVFSLFFQSAYHFSALAAGLSFLPANAVGSFLLIFVTGRLMRRFRLSTLIIAAMTSGLVGMVLIWLGVRTTFPVIMGGEVLFGAFAGLTASPVTALVMVNTPKAQAGIASGLLNAARQVGGMLGVAVLGTALGEGATGAGIQVASWIIAGACFVGLLLSINLAKRLREK
ncbi:MAG TPA: MFS transporter, partial [Ktedonobacteraceae bacterium]|nr:MFS transporter [Ktedonobacteraceae bacterium]